MSSESLSALDRLPSLVLDLIAIFLAASESERGSLFAFSSTSQACHQAAASQLFHHIHLSIWTPSKLRSDVEQWEQRLQRGNCHRHVRIIKLTGRMHHEPSDEAWYQVNGGGQWCVDGEQDFFQRDLEDYEKRLRQAEHDDISPLRSVAFSHDICRPPQVLQHGTISRRQLNDAEKEKHRQALEPLGQFLGRLPGLTDVVHACSDQFPFCLLHVLHERLPKCRLHLHTFCLRSLIRTPTDRRPIDPDDLALITSPCLYSIALPLTSYETVSESREKNDGFGHFRINHNHTDLIVRMITELSPNLAHVQANIYRKGRVRGQIGTARFFGARWPKLEDFFPIETKTATNVLRRTGALKSLVVPWNDVWASPHTSTTNMLKSVVQRNTSFTRLEVLDIHDYTTKETLTMLTDLGKSGSLPSLRSLRIYVSMAKNSEQSNVVGEEDGGSIDSGTSQSDALLSKVYGIDSAAAECLRSLLGLEELDISGILRGKTYKAILEHHGKSLRKLSYVPERLSGLCEGSVDFVGRRWTEDDLIKLAMKCQSLEYLRTYDVRVDYSICEDEFGPGNDKPVVYRRRYGLQGSQFVKS